MWGAQHEPRHVMPMDEETTARHSYFDEKATFAGSLVASMLFGMLTILFFKCMGALLDPAHRRGEPIKWGIVSYTVVIFLLATVQTTVGLHVQSISFIDHRDFPGVENIICRGPVGYQIFICHDALTIIPNAMFFLGGWLADGLLLHRCWVIYSMNIWAIALPCLMYLGSVATGINFIYASAVTYTIDLPAIPYYAITLLLNILLTSMIVVQLVHHARNARAAMGVSGIGGLYTAIVTMLVESCALYAVNLLLVIGPWAGRSHITNFFAPLLTETQAIAALLIVQRVADKSALTSEIVVSRPNGQTSSGTLRGSMAGRNSIPGGDRMSWMDGRKAGSNEFGYGVKMVDLDQGYKF